MTRYNVLRLVLLMWLGTALVLVSLSGCSPGTGGNATDASPGATVTPAGQEGEIIWFLSKRGYISGSGCPTAVGEVKNAGNSTVESIEITATFHCSKGRLIGAKELVQATFSASPEFPRLAPGETSPFKVAMSAEELSRLWNFDVDRVEKYRVVTSDYETTDEPSLYSDFEVTESAGELNADDRYDVWGTLKNSGNRTAVGVRVIGTFYDDEDRLIDVAHSDLKVSLPPGDEAGFTIIVPDESVSKRIETYRIQAVEYEEST